MTAAALIDRLNREPPDGFVATLKDIFEHSPWVAMQAAAGRPFADLESLHSAMVVAMLQAPQAAQLALLNAHPDLAGKEAEAGSLTAHSTSEQDSVGLTRLTPDEKARIVDLNAAYRKRHGFPFIICVRLRSKRQILAEFERRLNRETVAEFMTGLIEVGKIARLRLDALAQD